MARTIRDARLETRAARDRLAVGIVPHFKTLTPGKLHLGYRRKRKDEPGQWIVRHYLGNERYHIAPLGIADDFHDASDDNDVLSFAEAQRAALAHKQARQRGGKGMTVATAVAAYVKNMKEDPDNPRPAAAAVAERTADKLILPVLGRIKLADLTTEDITNWRADLAKAPARVRTRPGEQQKFKPAPDSKEALRARRATATRIWTILRAALNAAVALARKDGIALDPTPWQSVEPFKKINAARPGHLSVAEAKRLINAANPDSGFRDLVRAALYSGCRYGELRALDVRGFQHGKLHIRDSKSGEPRNVVLSDEGIAFFTQITAGRAGSEPLLTNRGRIERHRRADLRWRPSEQARPMRAACRAAKIVPEVGFHQLRHTWASLAIMNGMPLMVVARNLGHADTRMVERHYGHLEESYVDKAIRAGAPSFGFRRDKKVAALAR